MENNSIAQTETTVASVDTFEAHLLQKILPNKRIPLVIDFNEKILVDGVMRKHADSILIACEHSTFRGSKDRITFVTKPDSKTYYYLWALPFEKINGVSIHPDYKAVDENIVPIIFQSLKELELKTIEGVN